MCTSVCEDPKRPSAIGPGSSADSQAYNQNDTTSMKSTGLTMCSCWMCRKHVRLTAAGIMPAHVCVSVAAVPPSLLALLPRHGCAPSICLALALTALAWPLTPAAHEQAML